MVLNENQLRKRKFAEKLKKLINEYSSCLIVSVDFVGSNQLQETRHMLRGRAVVLMGKNTVIRRVLTEASAEKPELKALISQVQGNVGLIFTKGDNAEVRKIVQENKRPAPAKVGIFAPNDVIVPAGPTGLDPGQTGFFQAMEIPTKIMRGMIQIINDVHLLKTGDKVTASHVSFLAKMGVRPFSYGITVKSVYQDGNVFDAKVLDMSQGDIANSWFTGVRAVAALSLMTGMPTTASVPFSVKEAFRKLLAFTFVTKYSFKEAEDLDKLAAAGGGGGGGAAPASKAKEEKAAPKEESEDEAEESEDLDMGGLFGGDDDDEEEDDEEEYDEEEDEEDEE